MSPLPAHRRNAPPAPPVLEVRGLICRFAGGAVALDGVDLEVSRGEIVAVMGPTGAGKSTLLRCATGVVPRLQAATVLGERRLFGHPVDDLDPADIAGRVGLVVQDFEAQIFSTNTSLEVGFGLDQLGVEPAEIRRRSSEALDRVGLGGFERRDPATLSGGEKQRLALAAAWALGPELLLLDEPTTDIDPLGKEAIFLLLRELADAGAAVVLVEHEPAAARIADRLFLLESGRSRANGPSAALVHDVALLRSCGVRVRDLDAIAVGLGLGPEVDGVDAFEDALRHRGLRALDGGDGDRDAGSLPAPRSSGGAQRGRLDVEAVSHVYAEGVQALDGVSLTISPGEFVALVGQNGSGKTTLAHHLNGLLAPTSGRVRLDGVDLRASTVGRIARTVGFVFQDPDHQLFCDSVEEEVAFGLRHLGLGESEVADRTRSTLAACGLESRRADDPFLLGKGERQRLAVAAVLAIDPAVLILDEPTTGLDHREQCRMIELLRDLHRSGRTIVVITHAPWLVAEHAERAILLERGRILVDGPVAELLGRRDLLRRARFALPEATELGLRFGFAARSPQHLIAAVKRASGGAP